jgi:hypothetical protein
MAIDNLTPPTPLDALACATSDLESRFKISKSTRTKRLNLLGLFSEKLHKDGKKYWLTQQQLELFAEFDRYIAQTGSEEGYPKLHSDRSNRQVEEPPAEISTVFAELEKEVTGELAIPEQIFPDIAPTTLMGEFATASVETADPGDLLLQQINQNAQHRAMAIMVAEQTLANQYIQNPEALDPQLRAQIEAFQIPSIDPKGLAAKLISGAQRRLTNGLAG